MARTELEVRTMQFALDLIDLVGRVGALIALGAGFNPILTGREPKGWEARRTATEGWPEGCSAGGKAEIKIFTSMAPCLGSRKRNCNDLRSSYRLLGNFNP